MADMSQMIRGALLNNPELMKEIARQGGLRAPGGNGGFNAGPCKGLTPSSFSPRCYVDDCGRSWYRSGSGIHQIANPERISVRPVLFSGSLPIGTTDGTWSASLAIKGGTFLPHRLMIEASTNWVDPTQRVTAPGTDYNARDVLVTTLQIANTGQNPASIKNVSSSFSGSGAGASGSIFATWAEDQCMDLDLISVENPLEIGGTYRGIPSVTGTPVVQLTIALFGVGFLTALPAPLWPTP